jgi:hypothetical protein
MNTHAEKKQENKNQSVVSEVSQKQGGGESTFQFVDNRPKAVAQRKLQAMSNNSPRVKQLRTFQDMANNTPKAEKATQLQEMTNEHTAKQELPIQKKENNTGLPDNLKAGIENLSGYSMDDVKVHYNSDKPAQLQEAHAYAQGTDIHLGSGQEKHLPHEAWHVVQQKQGRVAPTIQMKEAIFFNDDAGLEKEADVMDAKALQMKADAAHDSNCGCAHCTASITQQHALGALQATGLPDNSVVAQLQCEDCGGENCNNGSICHMKGKDIDTKKKKRKRDEKIESGTEVRAKISRTDEYREGTVHQSVGSLSNLMYLVKFKDDNKKHWIKYNFVLEGPKKIEWKAPKKKKKVELDNPVTEETFSKYESSLSETMLSNPLLFGPVLRQGGRVYHGTLGMIAKKKGLKIPSKPSWDEEELSEDELLSKVGIAFQDTNSFGALGTFLDEEMMELEMPMKTSKEQSGEMEEEDEPEFRLTPLSKMTRNSSDMSEDFDLYDLHDRFIFKNQSSIPSDACPWSHQSKEKFKERKHLHSEAYMVNSPAWKKMVDGALNALSLEVSLQGGFDWVDQIGSIEFDASDSEPDEMQMAALVALCSALQRTLSIVINRSCCTTMTGKSGSGYKGGCTGEMSEVAKAFWKRVEAHFGSAVLFLVRNMGLLRLELSMAGMYDKGGIKEFQSLQSSGFDLRVHRQFDFTSGEKDTVSNKQLGLMDQLSEASKLSTTTTTTSGKKKPDKKKKKVPANKIRGEVASEIVFSVEQFLEDNHYQTDKNIYVVSGKNWTCYIRCVLHYLRKIDAYYDVIDAIKEENIDISSGVTVGDEQENLIRQIIAKVIGVDFYVEAEDAKHGNTTISSTQQGSKVSMVLTRGSF